MFSVDSCNFTDSFELEISCPDSDAKIYYIVIDRTNSAFGDMFDNLKPKQKDICDKCQTSLIHRTDDNDDKLVIVPEGKEYSDDAINALTEFQERR